MECSTWHVCGQTRDVLERDPSRWSIPGPRGSSGAYVALVHVPDHADEERDTPADLRAVIAYARELGCNFVMLDMDAPIVEGLTIYAESDHVQVP